MKLCKRILAAALVAVMFALCIPAFAAVEPEYPEAPEGYDGYITFSVSALTMGWTYLIDPVLVPVHEGETFDVVTGRAFEQLNWGYTVKPGVDYYYLTGVACYETEPMVPDYLMDEILAYPAWADEQFGYNFGGWNGEFVDDEMLSEYEYSDFAGWMFLVDGVSAPSGADATVVNIGSDYTWFFSIYGWGMDYGVSDGWGSFPVFENPMTGVNRSAAHIALAQLCADEEIAETILEVAGEEFENFAIALYDPNSPQELIDKTLEALLEALDADPAEYEPGDVNMDGAVDTVDALLVLRQALDIEQLGEAGAGLADIDGNGAIDTVDALLVLRLALGSAEAGAED